MIWLIIGLGALTGALVVVLVVALIMFKVHVNDPYTSAWSMLLTSIGIGAAIGVSLTATIVLAATS